VIKLAGTTESSLRESWIVQRRVLWALLLREILTRYGRHNIGFLWMFVEPMLFTLGVTGIWTALRSVHASNLPIVAFAVTGYSSVLLWRNMPSRCVGALTPNLSLLYHRNVKVLDIFVARLLLEAGGATISFVVLSIFFMTIGWMNPPEDVLQVAGGWLMLAWFGASFAILLGALSEHSEMVDKLWHPAAYLLFPLSGAAFLVDVLPKQVQGLILLLPMVHGVEYVREGYFGTQFVAHYDFGYMATCNLMLTWFALAQTRKVSRTVIPQ
jgi:ABC-2 type transport system permease protein/capsular polysaccharide transport system permease protein